MPEDINQIPSEQEDLYQVTLTFSNGDIAIYDSGNLVEIRQRISEVVFFSILNTLTGKRYEVDLENGLFKVGEEVFEFDLRVTKEVDGNTTKVGQGEFLYKLVYFRRVQDTGHIDNEHQLIVKKRVIMPVFGWQTEFEGKNYQRMVMIYPDGSISLFNKK